jgi:hypothetical protein
MNMQRKYRWATWGAATAGVVLAGTAVPPAMQTADAASAAVSPAIDWTACGDDGKAQCATLRLPVDWAHPGGPTFGLAIARRTALDRDARIGTLVFGPGGPGDSGVQRITRVNGGIDRFDARIRRRFGIVGFDPRGIGAGTPVTCSAALLAARPDPMIKSGRDVRAGVLISRGTAARRLRRR